jgi:hypothetical protein
MTIPEVSGGGGIDTDNEICIPNINQFERRKRLAAGVIQFLFSLAILVALIDFGASPQIR